MVDRVAEADDLLGGAPCHELMVVLARAGRLVVRCHGIC